MSIPQTEMRLAVASLETLLFNTPTKHKERKLEDLDTLCHSTLTVCETVDGHLVKNSREESFVKIKNEYFGSVKKVTVKTSKFDEMENDPDALVWKVAGNTKFTGKDKEKGHYHFDNELILRFAYEDGKVKIREVTFSKININKSPEKTQTSETSPDPTQFVPYQHAFQGYE